MTATSDQLAIDVRRVVLLRFQWGDASSAYFARYDEDLSDGTNTFTARPEMVIGRLRRTGALDAETLNIETVNDVEPFSVLTTRFRVAPVKCTVYIANPDNVASTKREVFYGKVASVEVVGGDDNTLYRYEVKGIKSDLTAKLGVYANNYCQNIFGDARCRVGVAALRKNATVTDVGTDGREMRVTVSWTGGTPDLSDARWRGGALIWDGAIYSIAASAGSSKFDLIVDPPAAIDGATVVMEPGCDGKLDTCRNTWNNETNALILGLDMQDRYPLTEVA